MQRYLLKISFDGTDYHGWQVQPNGITVQKKLQDAFNILYGYSPDLTGCSRTDSGVHANEFYCHFDLKLKNNIPAIGIVKGLNSVLPNSIRALECSEVANDFHCRYLAKKKNYIYVIDNREISDPFSSRYSYQYQGTLDIELMNYFCSTLVGKHDFSGFASSNRKVGNSVREIYSCFVNKTENSIILSVTANGFLYNMVRIIVGTAIEVGKGRLNKDIAYKIFETGNRSFGGATAPAHGLFLNKVWY